MLSSIPGIGQSRPKAHKAYQSRGGNVKNSREQSRVAQKTEPIDFASEICSHRGQMKSGCKTFRGEDINAQKVFSVFALGRFENV